MKNKNLNIAEKSKPSLSEVAKTIENTPIIFIEKFERAKAFWDRIQKKNETGKFI